MSWLSNGLSDFVKASGNAWKVGTSLGGVVDNDVSRFFERELVNKSQLRGAEAEGILSGVPIVGDFVRGIEGVNQMEDLYNRTGKVANYPGASNLGSSSIGHAIADLPNKIADGTHDLYQFYTGDTSDIWNQMSNKANWNSKYHHYRERMI